jgi:hypothetical protein
VGECRSLGVQGVGIIGAANPTLGTDFVRRFVGDRHRRFSAHREAMHTHPFSSDDY